MGRRALPKVPKDVDLSGHFVRLEPKATQLDLPPPFCDLDGPLEVEVGSGKGLFLTEAARSEPDRRFLGIEIAGKYARFIAYRLARQQLPNAVIVHGDAEQLFRDCLADEQATAVHIYFPDPWWKKRHHKRRIMNQTFLTQVERVLRPGGRLHFWTDVEPYFQESLPTIATATDLTGPLEVAEADPMHDLDYRTHFERRKRKAGLPIFRSEFVKASTRSSTA